MLTRLGFLYQARGNADLALSYYQRAFTLDQDRAVVANNLGVVYARRGMLARSVELWRRTFANNPHLSEIGVNLANGLCALGDADGARTVLQRVLLHNPDFGTARQALADQPRMQLIPRPRQTPPPDDGCIRTSSVGMERFPGSGAFANPKVQHAFVATPALIFARRVVFTRIVKGSYAPAD